MSLSGTVSLLRSACGAIDYTSMFITHMARGNAASESAARTVLLPKWATCNYLAYVVDVDK